MKIRLPLTGTRISAKLGDPSDKIKYIPWTDIFIGKAGVDYPHWTCRYIETSLDLDNAECEYEILIENLGQTPQEIIDQQAQLDNIISLFDSSHPGIGPKRLWSGMTYTDLSNMTIIESNNTKRQLTVEEIVEIAQRNNPT